MSTLPLSTLRGAPEIGWGLDTINQGTDAITWGNDLGKVRKMARADKMAFSSM